jgi:hypothetical protein
VADLVAVLEPPGRAADPGFKCSADKVKEAAKYSACRLKAESKSIKKGEAADVSKCNSKYSEKWQQAESKAGGACPTNGDEDAIKDQVVQFAAGLAGVLKAAPCQPGAVALGGACWYLTDVNGNCEPLPFSPPDLSVCIDEGLVYDSATETYAGSGGTIDRCEAVLNALGISAVPMVRFGCAGPVGCAYTALGPSPEAVWCQTDTTTANARRLGDQRACACK